MNHLFNIVKKELRELLTPSTIIPMVLIVVIFASMGPLMSGSIDDATSPVKVGVLNADTADVDGLTTLAIETIDENDLVSELVFFESRYDDVDAITKEMSDKGVSTLLVISPDYSSNIDSGTYGTITTYWHQADLGGLVDLSEAVAATLVGSVSQVTSLAIIEEVKGTDPADPNFVRDPVPYNKSQNTWIILSTGVFQGVAPSDVSGALMMQNMFISIVMMMIIIMIGSILVSSMGNEKENKTLETLLTLPVSRTTVVGGKIIGSAIVGLLFGVVYLIGMYFMMGSSGTIGGVDLDALGLALGPMDWAIVGVFLFMAIVCALGLCMILGAFAKNYKAAQTLIMPITILAMVPMLLTVFGSFGSFGTAIQAVMFAIPFSHPMMIMENLMFDNTAMVLGGFAYLLAFAAITLFITVRLYKSDILLTGYIRKKGKRSGSKGAEDN